MILNFIYYYNYFSTSSNIIKEGKINENIGGNGNTKKEYYMKTFRLRERINGFVFLDGFVG